MCVFAVPIYFLFFLKLLFWLMIFLWFLVVSCFGNAYDFAFVFVAVCFFLLYALCILCLLPCLTTCSFIDVLSCTPTGVSEINDLTCNNSQATQNITMHEFPRNRPAVRQKWVKFVQFKRAAPQSRPFV